MNRKTIFCAQPFWLNAGRVVPGELYQFSTAERAIEGARILEGSAPGVAVFSLTGHPDTDDWDEPVLIQTVGCAPALAA